MEFKHEPVLLNECIEALKIKKDGIYVDGTLGGAGHSEEIVKKLESGDIPLDDAIEKWTEGMNLANKCNKMLEEANETITKSLTNEGTLENFDISE